MKERRVLWVEGSSRWLASDPLVTVAGIAKSLMLGYRETASASKLFPRIECPTTPEFGFYGERRAGSSRFLVELAFQNSYLCLIIGHHRCRVDIIFHHCLEEQRLEGCRITSLCLSSHAQGHVNSGVCTSYLPQMPKVPRRKSDIASYLSRAGFPLGRTIARTRVSLSSSMYC